MKLSKLARDILTLDVNNALERESRIAIHIDEDEENGVDVYYGLADYVVWFDLETKRGTLVLYPDTETSTPGYAYNGLRLVKDSVAFDQLKSNSLSVSKFMADMGILADAGGVDDESDVVLWLGAMTEEGTPVFKPLTALVISNYGGDDEFEGSKPALVFFEDVGFDEGIAHMDLDEYYNDTIYGDDEDEETYPE